MTTAIASGMALMNEASRAIEKLAAGLPGADAILLSEAMITLLEAPRRHSIGVKLIQAEEEPSKRVIDLLA